MLLVKGAGGSEKVTIDGIKVKRKMNLKTYSGEKILKTTQGTITKVFKINKDIYICIGQKLHKFNIEENTLTFLANAQTQYIFYAGNDIYCAQYKHINGENWSNEYIYIYKYNSVNNKFEFFEQDRGISNSYSSSAKNGGIMEVYDGYYYRKYSHKSLSRSLEIGSAPTSIKVPQSICIGTKKRHINYNNNLYINLTNEPNDTGNKQFTMYVNNRRYEYIANNDFIETYENGSLAIVNNKIWMYGSNPKTGITKRIQWVNNTYKNEEIIDDKNANINNCIIIENGNELIYIGQNNKIFKNDVYYKEV